MILIISFQSNYSNCFQYSYYFQFLIIPNLYQSFFIILVIPNYFYLFQIILFIVMIQLL